ncbi:MAG TPA: glycosyltransferase family 4 protein [Bryobacteraceae bacterium]|nr:glycosyltransferase family 4 protein [Bryobacteraceae bacterium]
MNVLFLDQFSDLGGAQQCLLDLVPAIQASGWNMTCAVPGDGMLIRKLRDRGVPVHSLRLAPLTSGRKKLLDFWRFAFDAPRLARRISSLAAETHADLLYVNGPRVLPAAAWAARKSGRPLVFHCHSHLGDASARKLAGRSLQLASARVIACCRYVARPLWPFIDPGRLHIIYNGVAATGAEIVIKKSGPSIGLIGRISPEKGQVEFVLAAQRLAGKYARCQFIICGAPLFSSPQAHRYFERVREVAAGLPVVFRGWQDDVNAVLSGLDVLVVPSLHEPGAPRIILEAFAARVPVVAFASGGIPEIVIQNKTGFLIEPPEPQALAAKLDALLQAPGQLHDIVGHAYETWKEKFTLERYQREVLAVMGLTQTLSATGRSI